MVRVWTDAVVICIGESTDWCACNANCIVQRKYLFREAVERTADDSGVRELWRTVYRVALLANSGRNGWTKTFSRGLETSMNSENFCHKPNHEF